jgi:hypothetical protein
LGRDRLIVDLAERLAPVPCFFVGHGADKPIKDAEPRKGRQIAQAIDPPRAEWHVKVHGALHGHPICDEDGALRYFETEQEAG